MAYGIIFSSHSDNIFKLQKELLELQWQPEEETLVQNILKMLPFNISVHISFSPDCI